MSVGGFYYRNYPRYLARWRRYRDYTMVPRKRYVDNLYLAHRYVGKRRLGGGAYVECGTWAGGMSFGILDACPDLRECHFFDSFEGLPPATELDGEVARTGRETGALIHDGNTADHDTFVANLERFKHPHQRTTVHRGWFEKTLPGFRTEAPIAVLRLDGDWYESTLCALEHLFDQVAHNGLILIDDYYDWEGCSRAVHDFLSSRKALERLRQSAHGVAYMFRIHPELVI